MANIVDPDQTAPMGAVCSWSTLFASILNLSVMIGNYLQQTTSADDIFRSIFFLALLGLSSIISPAIVYHYFDMVSRLNLVCQFNTHSLQWHQIKYGYF